MTGCVVCKHGLALDVDGRSFKIPTWSIDSIEPIPLTPLQNADLQLNLLLRISQYPTLPTQPTTQPTHSRTLHSNGPF